MAQIRTNEEELHDASLLHKLAETRGSYAFKCSSFHNLDRELLVHFEKKDVHELVSLPISLSSLSGELTLNLRLVGGTLQTRFVRLAPLCCAAADVIAGFVSTACLRDLIRMRRSEGRPWPAVKHTSCLQGRRFVIDQPRKAFVAGQRLVVFVQII